MSRPTVWLPEPLKSAATLRAKAEGVTLNAFVARAVQAYLQPVSSDQKPDPLEGDRFECPRRFQPTGLLGADFYVEWRRSLHAGVLASNREWYAKADPRQRKIERDCAVLEVSA